MTTPSARHERECPYCAETILVRAKICKHCGRDVIAISTHAEHEGGAVEEHDRAVVPAEADTYAPPAKAPRLPRVGATRTRSEAKLGLTPKSDPLLTFSVLFVFVAIAADFVVAIPGARALTGWPTARAPSGTTIKGTSPIGLPSSNDSRARTDARYDSTLDSLPRGSRDTGVDSLPSTETQILGVTVSIPTTVPTVDLPNRVANDAASTASPDPETHATKSGSATVTQGPPPFSNLPTGRRASATAASEGEDETYFERQVDKPVTAAPGSPSPIYPDILKSAGVEGEVVVSFTVDTTGRVIMSTVNFLKSTHGLFADAVRTALPKMRFVPAEIGGRKVKQLIQQPFVFNIVK